MALQYKAQDLLKVTRKTGVIAHQINAVGAIGGLNKGICQIWPGNGALIRQQDSPLPLSTVLYYSNESVCIANMVSQVWPGAAGTTESDSYESRRLALYDCLVAVQSKSDLPIHVPYNIACGLAGDRWQHVEPVLQQAAETRDIIVCVPFWAEEHCLSLGYELV